jgi:hypothetical protein
VNVPEPEGKKHTELPVAVNIPGRLFASGDRVAEKFITKLSKLITIGAKDPEN